MSGGELKDDVKEELKARLDALQRQFGGKHTGALNIFATELIIARWLAVIAHRRRC
jgi:CRISPR-associated protein, crm2 family